MSELERERHKNAGLERARDSWYQEWFKGTERIAELEADVQREHDCVEHWSLRAETAEAELAALKARRCHTCADKDRCLSRVEFVGGHWPVDSCSLWDARP